MTLPTRLPIEARPRVAPYEITDAIGFAVGWNWRDSDGAGELLVFADPGDFDAGHVLELAFPPHLSVSRATIPADGASAAVVTYTNTRNDAPAEITFDVNGAAVTEALLDGTASIEVTAAAPGPIVISCEGLEVTVQAEEV